MGSTIALDGCRIDRLLEGAVEIVEARAADRRFPARVTQSLGVCLKTGPGHLVTADGREVVYPEDALCLRPPGCVWSTATTGAVGFLSIDLDPSLLPGGLRRGAMAFAVGRALPDLGGVVRRMRRSGSWGRTDELVVGLVLALGRSGVVRADELRASASQRISRRAREALEGDLVDPPGLGELARGMGVSRFALLRRFKSDFGVTPHAFVLRRSSAGPRRARAGTTSSAAGARP